MLVKRHVLLAKAETVYSTDAAPTGVDDAVLVSNLSFSPAGQKMHARNVVTPTLGQLKQIYGGALIQFSFDVEVKGSGAAGTAPEYGPLLQSCGMSETVVASTSVTYAPASSAIKSATIWFYQDGKLHKATGCRGTFNFTAPVGGPAIIKFTMTGHFVSETDVALTAPTYDATVPVPVISAAFTIGAYAAIITQLAFDMGNTVATPGDVNAADGYGQIQIIDRDVNGSFNPEDTLIATKDFRAAWRAGTELALATGVIGGVAGNRWQLTMPQVCYRDVTPGERDGLSVLDIKFGAAKSAGNDELTLAFT